MKVKVTERALLARLQRKLEKENLLLKKCRFNDRSRGDLGEYYLVDIEINGVCDTDIDLGILAKQYDCIKDYEELG